MNLTPGQAHEAYIGPPSEAVEVAAFVKQASELQAGSEEFEPLPVFSQSASQLPREAREAWSSLPENEQDAIKAECRVDDLRKELEDVIQNPRLMGHVMRTHEASLHSIQETVEPSNRRKRKRVTIADPDEEHPEVTALRLQIDATKLKCWPLQLHAASFIRAPRQSDHNTLIHVKRLGFEAAGERDAMHVLLSSQTLGDLYRAMPCSSKELPVEVRDESGQISGYGGRPTAEEDGMDVDHEAGVVMCIENVLHGTSKAVNDYAAQVLALVDSLPEGKQPELAMGSPLNETRISSLTLRLHEPYWMLHAGNCEHFFAVTCIRARHPTDPESGYPLTTQITPPLLDFCRVCVKVPATYSIVGDIRLGESPYLICGPCWRWMGESKEEGVLVVPLPKHQEGWTRHIS
ncbi:snRNA-activating protein of 50kDa MW C terminal-domain-containing protein [Trametes polyzona]|nr:snRNA-activating protein of 50kDa MW C terminal-domain-containing protein [Trametes polyzona]